MHNNPDNRVLLAFFLDLLGDVGCRVLCSTFRRAQGQGRESRFPESACNPKPKSRRASAKLEEIRLMLGESHPWCSHCRAEPPPRRNSGRETDNRLIGILIG